MRASQVCEATSIASGLPHGDKSPAERNQPERQGAAMLMCRCPGVRHQRRIRHDNRGDRRWEPARVHSKTWSIRGVTADKRTKEAHALNEAI